MIFWLRQNNFVEFDLSNMTEESSIYQIRPKTVRFIKYDRRQFDLLTMTEDNWRVFRKIWKNFKLKYDADSASVFSYCLNTQNMSYKTQPKLRSSLITEITLLHSFVQIILQVDLVELKVTLSIGISKMWSAIFVLSKLPEIWRTFFRITQALFLTN